MGEVGVWVKAFTFACEMYSTLDAVQSCQTNSGTVSPWPHVWYGHRARYTGKLC